MRLRIRDLIAVVLFFGFVGCVLFVDEYPGNSYTRDSGLKFSHAKHTQMASCLDCHKNAVNSAKAGMPEGDSCKACHESADHSKEENESCYMCHSKPIAKQTRPKPDIYADVIFNHATHVKSEKDCALCHASAAEAVSLSDIGFPGKRTVCLKCHETDYGRVDRCAICHTEKRMNRKPANHDMAWKRFHGDNVESGFFEKEWYNCRYCHEQSSCDECHMQEEPRSHNESWVKGTHGLAADVDRMRCSTCHRENECLRCHAQAPPYPRNAIHTGPAANCTGTCHSRVHRYVTRDCKSCHR